MTYESYVGTTHASRHAEENGRWKQNNFNAQRGPEILSNATDLNIQAFLNIQDQVGIAVSRAILFQRAAGKEHVDQKLSVIVTPF